TVLVDFAPLSAPFVASALFVITLTAAAWALRRRAPWLLAAWGAHLVLLVPALGLTERPHYPSDRYDHVAGIVLAVLVAALLLRARAAALAVALAVVVGLGALSVRQQAIWHDDVSLHVHTLETLGDDPYRVDLYERLGDLFTRRGDFVRAARAWDGALAARPDAPRARYERARARLRLGDFAGAVADADVLLGVHDEPALRELRGLGLVQLGRLDEAIAELARAAPTRPSAARSLAVVALLRATVGASR
ncbi:MAG TPA: tetratricopeptide repeat protein, partial [Polyangia bacterium]